MRLGGGTQTGIRRSRDRTERNGWRLNAMVGLRYRQRVGLLGVSHAMRTTKVQQRLDAGRIVLGDLLQVFDEPGDRDPLLFHAHPPAERRRRRGKENQQQQQPHGATPSFKGRLWAIYPVYTDGARIWMVLVPLTLVSRVVGRVFVACHCRFM